MESSSGQAFPRYLSSVGKSRPIRLLRINSAAQLLEDSFELSSAGASFGELT